MKRGKLPLKTALKMGLSVKKPVRFCFTVLLAAVAFGMTGLAMLAGFYDEARAKVQTYVKNGDILSLYASEPMPLGTVRELSADWGIPCGALSAQSASYPATSEDGHALGDYAQQNHVHTTLCCGKIACYDGELFSARGIGLLAGALGENGVLLPDCFANGLIAIGLAEGWEELIGHEIALRFPEGEAQITVAGIYNNATCNEARRYAEEEGQLSSLNVGACTGGTVETGALFVSEELFETLGLEADSACFAGDGSAATGEKVRRFLDAHTDYQCDLFVPFLSFRDGLAKLTNAAGGIGGVLAAFSALMIFQFIHLSIDGKRQMIGILRALGGRGADVAKIFLIESGFIGILSGIFAVGFAAGLVPMANMIFETLFNAKNVVILTYQPLAFVLVIAMSLGVALLSALIPVLREVKRLPVDVIKFNAE